MFKGFWEKIEKPIFVMAPMADVTDPALRQIVAKYGKPDVTWTEFVSADGLFLGGKEALLPDLDYTDEERPIIAQFFTSKPEMMEKAARLALELGFDGIDINMGCPDKSIEKQGAGATLIKNPTLARELIAAAKEGAKTDKKQIPVSVKTRIGFNKNEIDTWIPNLLNQDIPLLTVHLRTRKELSKVPAHWEEMHRVIKIRNEISKETLIFGNGDILSLQEAYKKTKETGADGVMLGKAIFGNPWLFEDKEKIKSGEAIEIIERTPQQKIEALIQLAEKFNDLLGERKNFAIMKKHFKAYISGWDGAKELRTKLMDTHSYDDMSKVLNNLQF